MQMKDAAVNIGVRQEEIQKFIFDLDEKLGKVLEKLDGANSETAQGITVEVYEMLDEIYQKI